MLATLRSILDDLVSGHAPPRFGPEDTRVAATALLAHVVAIDGTLSEAEKQRVRALLQSRYGLEDDEARALIRVAVMREREAFDLDEFTGLLARRLDEPARRDLVAMMWDVARADGTVHEFEESLIWRVAQLLGVADAGRNPA